MSLCLTLLLSAWRWRLQLELKGGVMGIVSWSQWVRVGEDGRTLGGTRQRLLGSLWLRHNHIGVVEEGARAQVVIIDALRMCLQIALHILSAE